MLRFIVYHNDQPIKTYEVDDPVITIGRLPENTISIANMGVSRRHVRIERDANSNYVLSDLNSLNGTFVNDKKLKRATLNQGDRIGIGKYIITCEYLNHQPAAADYIQQNQNFTSPPIEQPPQGYQDKQTVSQPAISSLAASAVMIETGKHVVYKIDKPLLSIGSSDEDDIFVSGFMIGENHLFIEQKDDGFWIHSKKKMAKFKVNGKKTNKHKLEHKDRLEIGNSTFRFMENG
ncbi:MAG: FHA domain-containing protein [Fibrobacterota bacterium]